MEQVNRDFASKRAIARHPGAQPRFGNKTRSLAVVLLIALLLLCSAIAAGLRINGTHSFPVGFYFAIRKRPEKGDLVFVDPPALPLFTLAKERGYLNVAYSPTPHLVKRLAGVEVNGIRLANSAPCNWDGAGRPLRPYVLKDHILGPDEVLLMSDYNPASFDSRYFGPLQATTIESVIKPLLTWN